MIGALLRKIWRLYIRAVYLNRMYIAIDKEGLFADKGFMKGRRWNIQEIEFVLYVPKRIKTTIIVEQSSLWDTRCLFHIVATA